MRFIRNDAANGKKALSEYLNSAERHVRYFAVVALAGIGDQESRQMLRSWVTDHVKTDPNFSCIIVSYLLALHDFSRVQILTQIDANALESFAISQLEVIARAHLHVPGLREAVDARQLIATIAQWLFEMLASYPFLAK